MRRIKPVFRCADADKKVFKNSQCLLTISVGQEIHEGEKFDTTIELVNNSFKSCIMLIDDTLQRHTMALNRKENSDFFYDISLKEGDLWLARNEIYYKKLTILNKVIRWDSWLQHPNYFEQQSKIISLIESDFVYRKAFEETIDEFLERYIRRKSDKADMNMERAHSLCFNYLVEECSALCLWVELSCNFEVYPNRRNRVMDETHKRFVLQDHPNLLHSVAIKFKNRKQLYPQHFGLLQKEMVS